MADAPERAFFVVGVTHVDLAWKRGREEMTEMLEVLVVRLLDALERYPSFRYMIEQAAHYRTLAQTRPDLLERLKPYVREGRLEMVGGMASTLDTNLPCGESLVRNHLLGTKWVRENFGVDVRTGWLFDTFGVNAQVPQVLRQFGLSTLMANRFGGVSFHDTFRARGLDGSEVLVVGREFYSGFVRKENTHRVFYRDWDGIDRLFSEADELPGDGPFLLIPYVENEYLLSLRPLKLAEERDAARPGESWRMATPGEYFAVLEATGRDWPVFHADLNPEFTGCFSLRPTIRLRNRRAEYLLLEAEKWASLRGLTGWQGEVEEAWWQMAFLQFHDVFTGSHPTAVYRDVLRGYDAVDEAASRLLDRALSTLLPPGDAPAAAQAGAGGAAGTATLLAVNGLPFERTDVVTAALPEGAAGVERVADDAGRDVPFDVRGGRLRFLATLPPGGARAFFVEGGASRPGDAAAAAPAEVVSAAIENEFVVVECDDEVGLRRLVWKPTGAVLIDGSRGDLLVAQRDDGSFQIESPNGAEVAAAAGAVRVFGPERGALGETVRLAGEFPVLPWAGAANRLTWEVALYLPPGAPEVRLSVRLDWKGEGTRLRLKVPTTVDSAGGVYEIPFGTVRRRPYGTRGNARGEWPAHRFVAVEDGRYGVALANTGVGGVEVSGGTILTTLLRAPKSQEVGMAPDDTSSQHGAHAFEFALLPYAGSWDAAGVARRAQALNEPVSTLLRPGRSAAVASGSHVRLDSEQAVLSCVKAADDGSGDLVVRFYETTGREARAALSIPGAARAWHSDVRERRGDPLPCAEGRMETRLNPYEIKTVRLTREG